MGLFSKSSIEIKVFRKFCQEARLGTYKHDIQLQKEDKMQVEQLITFIKELKQAQSSLQQIQSCLHNIINDLPKNIKEIQNYHLNQKYRKIAERIYKKCESSKIFENQLNISLKKVKQYENTIIKQRTLIQKQHNIIQNLKKIAKRKLLIKQNDHSPMYLERILESLINKLEEQRRNIFSGSIILPKNNNKKLLVEKIENSMGGKLVNTNLLYKTDNRCKQLSLINKEFKNLFLAGRTTEGKVIGGFLSLNSQKGNSFIYKLNQKGLVCFELIKGKKNVEFDSKYLIFGKSELRLDYESFEINCCFQVEEDRRNYQTNGQSSQNFLQNEQSKTKTRFSQFQIYTLELNIDSENFPLELQLLKKVQISSNDIFIADQNEFSSLENQVISINNPSRFSEKENSENSVILQTIEQLKKQLQQFRDKNQELQLKYQREILKLKKNKEKLIEAIEAEIKRSNEQSDL